VSTQETEGSHKKEALVTCEETGEEGTDWQHEIKCKLQQPVLVGKCREKDNNKIEDKWQENSPKLSDMLFKSQADLLFLCRPKAQTQVCT